MSTIGTFGSFTQARLAIYASQMGLSVTGNNISNINTKGYTRQRLDQTSFYAGGADRYYSTTSVRVGNGVLCRGVSQLRDPYLDIRFRDENANVGAMDAMLGGLEGIEAILDEVGDGDEAFGILSDRLNDLYKSLQQLTDQTGQEVYDTQVRAAADALVRQINSYAAKLNQLKENSIKGFDQDVKTVNNILTQIRDLNATIRKSEIHGDPALELRDERNVLIDQLSSYMKINVTYEPEDIGGGQTVDRLVIRLGDANPDLAVDTDSSYLVYGTYATQLSYIDKGDPTKTTDNIEQANANYDLQLSALKDKHDRVLNFMEKSDPTQITSDEYKDFLADNGGPSKSEPQADGSTKITVVSKGRGGKYYTQTYIQTPSKAVSLDDNDLRGALQSQRELLTESGEFAYDDTVDKVDERARSKRGIPYYQRSLDLLANQIANAFNKANNGYMYNEKGEYLGKDGQVLTDGNGDPYTTKMPMDDALKAILDADGQRVGFNMFSNGNDTNDGTGITASNISISKDWASGETLVRSYKIPSGAEESASTDSTNILHMVALFSTKMDYIPKNADPDSPETSMFNGTFGEMWDNIGSVLGHDKRETTIMLDTYYASTVDLDTSRDSVSSVDLNDEAMNLMQYSKSYNAACRLMTTYDSVLDKLINGTGITT